MLVLFFDAVETVSPFLSVSISGKEEYQIINASTANTIAIMIYGVIILDVSSCNKASFAAASVVALIFVSNGVAFFNTMAPKMRGLIIPAVLLQTPMIL